MRKSRSYKYKNYGSIPQNEYGANNTEKNTDFASSGFNPGDVAYKQRLMKQQAPHPSGLRKSSGWANTWKTNGWRAESTSPDDEFTDTDRYSRYAKRNDPL